MKVSEYDNYFIHLSCVNQNLFQASVVSSV